MSLHLWEQVVAWKSSKYRFVDLTHELSSEIPRHHVAEGVNY